jgi:hypothetical protein
MGPCHFASSRQSVLVNIFKNVRGTVELYCFVYGMLTNPVLSTYNHKPGREKNYKIILTVLNKSTGTA